MIEPYSATTIILLFLLVFGLIVPIIGTIPKLKEIVSLRYLTLVVWLACMIGIIVNFGALPESIKLAVVIGCGIMSATFILVRSYEKVSYNHNLKAIVQKGDAKAEIEIKKAESDK
jgi:hypothetical protein